MANRSSKNNLLMGAAVAAGLLGTLTSLFRPRRSSKGWAEQAKDMANTMGGWRTWGNNKKDSNKNLFLGGVAGSLVGITTALLLAPKSGSELIKELSHSFQQHTIGRTAHRGGSHHKKAHTTIKHQAAASRVHHKGSSAHASAKKAKPSPVKKRTSSRKAKVTATEEKSG